MDAPSAKEYLHEDLRWVREAMIWKVDGLSEYDARRPLTRTGTNLLGLIKHLAVSESWYFGEVFGRPFHVPWWPRPDVTLFKILIHLLTETNRHAGHADILREQLDGATGQASDLRGPRRDAAFWEARRAKVEQAARAASDAASIGGSAV